MPAHRILRNSCQSLPPLLHLIMYVMICERFPSVVGGHLESVIFPPDTRGHGEFLHFKKKRKNLSGGSTHFSSHDLSYLSSHHHSMQIQVKTFVLVLSIARSSSWANLQPFIAQDKMPSPLSYFTIEFVLGRKVFFYVHEHGAWRRWWWTVVHNGNLRHAWE